MMVRLVINWPLLMYCLSSGEIVVVKSKEEAIRVMER